MAAKRILWGTGTAISCIAIYGSITYIRPMVRSIRKANNLSIKDVYDAPESFYDLQRVRKLVNPRAHPESHDAHTVTLELPVSAELSDELLLARFVKGFFGGWVFSPEGKVLALVKPQDMQYTSQYRDVISVGEAASNQAKIELQGTTVPAHIWSASEISDTHLLPMHTVVFGQFRLGNMHLAENNKQQDYLTYESIDDASEESYVDFIFGSDMESFAGCHRLSVRRLPPDDADSAPKAEFKLACMACNPQANRAVGPNAIIVFHRLYSRMLFREAVGYINETINQQI